MTVTMIPKIAKSTGASVKCPSFTKVESLLIIIPDSFYFRYFSESTRSADPKLVRQFVVIRTRMGIFIPKT